MILATTITPPHATSHLWFNTFTVIIVSLAVGVILWCIKLLFQIFAEEERLRREHREDHERADAANKKHQHTKGGGK